MAQSSVTATLIKTKDLRQFMALEVRRSIGLANAYLIRD